MQSETHLAPPAPDSLTLATSERTFAVQLGCSLRSASLARRIAVRQLAEWGYARDTDTSQTAALLVAELCTNAVTHGRVPGRDFRLRLAEDTASGVLRIEVCDANPKRPSTARVAPSPCADHGRGLFLVAALATRWGVTDRDPIGKTVWAECALP